MIMTGNRKQETGNKAAGNDSLVHASCFLLPVFKAELCL